MEHTQLKWKDYEMTVDLHRSYLDLAIKLNMFYYAITGAILSFHFANTSLAIAKHALLFPLFLGIGLTVFFFWAARLAHNLRSGIKNRAHALGLDAYPEGIILVMLCLIFGAVLLLVSLALGGYLYFF